MGLGKIWRHIKKGVASLPQSIASAGKKDADVARGKTDPAYSDQDEPGKLTKLQEKG